MADYDDSSRQGDRPRALFPELEMSQSGEFKSIQESYSNSNSEASVHPGMTMKQRQKRKFKDDEPPDRFFLVLLSVYIFGIASLLPWNFFITANDYWMYKFRNSSTDESNYKVYKTNLQKAFTSYLAIASTGPMVLAHIFNASVSHRITLKVRLGTALLVSFLMAVLTAALTKVDTTKYQSAFFGVTISTAAVINAMSAILQGGSVGLAGCLPERYMKATILGMSTGGIFAALAEIASLSNPHPTDSALAYFLCATLVLGFAGLIFIAVLRTDFYRYHMATQIVGKEREVGKSSDVSLVDIFKKIKVYAFSLFLLFTVTLSVFPGVLVLTTSMTPSSSIWTNRLFLPICCFLLFNLGDLSGRLIGGWLTLPQRKRWWTVPILLLHLLHVPLLMLCNSHPRSNLPVVFSSDVYFITFVTTLGLLNGYLCTTFFIRGPKCVQKEYQQTAGTMMGAFQGIGLMTGSIISYGLVSLL